MQTSVEEWLFLIQRSGILVEATETQQIAKLEAEFGFSQQDAVTNVIEATDLGAHVFPQYQNGNGTAHERLAALRVKWPDFKKLIS